MRRPADVRPPLVKPEAMEDVRRLRGEHSGSDDHAAFAREFIRIANHHGQDNLLQLIEASLKEGNPRDFKRALAILRQTGINARELE